MTWRAGADLRRQRFIESRFWPRFGPSFGPETGDPHWYKDAVFYELRVRSFADSNADGIGDFPGLTSRLGYLQDLGVTTLWLLPICPSPGRDDGYDISDYTDVQPELGTLDDFRVFLDEAHARGMRVVTELVLNHTSDAHPWFQRARRSPPGSPERDFYVWSDTADHYRDARIIFKDFEPSNWSWDPVAKAYFWHRFYAHQPDLNLDNPAVGAALFEVVDFWFGLGVDGLRLDAVPYLFERDGTSCENLPETHAWLRELRRHVDEKFAHRMLLAEANQWPEEAAAYFGVPDAPECHMNFHFPIMPRIFMAIHMEDRLPIADILAQTPKLDDSCQWALFLRNHDELTLEMVTDEERDYMYRAFARETAARINLGIRRRLAPLLGNNRRNIELVNGLLCSLPGTPVIYYGDEIAMGDNIYLGDRNGVRTPMQWSADKNAGFSRANPQRLVLPVIIDPEYHYESVNVEAQQQNPNSLLWWMKRLIALRKRFRAFGRGGIEFLSPDNPRVIAFIREWEDERILVVANLSRRVQFVELNLGRYRGQVPVELFGRTRFPPIGELPYLLTLGEHAFYWFALEASTGHEKEAREAAYAAPMLELSRSQRWEGVFDPGERGVLQEVLLGYVEARRWFEGRERELSDFDVLDVVRLYPGGDAECPLPIHLVIAWARYAAGEPERFILPLAVATDEHAQAIRARSPQAVVASLRLPPPAPSADPSPGQSGQSSLVEAGQSGPSSQAAERLDAGSALLVDALADAPTACGMLAAIRAQRREKRNLAQLWTTWLGGRREPVEARVAESLAPRLLKVEHRQAAVVFGDRYVLKFMRRFEEGTSVELEVARYFAACAASKHPPSVPPPVAPLAGAIEYQAGRGDPDTVAVLLGHVDNEGTAWDFVRGELGRCFERALSRGIDSPPPPCESRSLLELCPHDPPPAERDVMGSLLAPARLLGQRTGELHLALACDPTHSAFAPEPWSSLDQRSLYQSERNATGKVLRLLRQRLPALSQRPEAARLLAAAHVLLDGEEALYKRFEPLRARRFGIVRTRVHGDYHLENVLYTGKDFVVIGFDGDPTRSLAERRRKRPPLDDVATMIRSLSYATFGVVGDEAVVRADDRAAAEPWARCFYSWAAAAFLGSWLHTVAGASFVPSDPADLALLLDALQIKKALRGIGAELERRPERAVAALEDLLLLLGNGTGSAS